MGSRTYTILLVLGVGGIISLLGYIFFSGSSKKSSPPLNNISGSAIQYNNYNTVSATNAVNLIEGGKPSFNSQFMLNEINNENIQKRGGNISYNSAFYSNNELTSTTLTKKGGANFYYTGADTKEADPKTLNLNLPKRVTGGDAGLNRKMCLRIMSSIANDSEKINAMSDKDKYRYILTKLKYSPGFGGLSFARQDSIVNQIIKEIAEKGFLREKFYCDDIEKGPSIDSYTQCIKIMEGIMKDKISNPSEILKRLRQINSFDMIPASDKESIVQLIVTGLKNDDLSIEYICSTIQSLISGEMEGFALYKQCLIIIEQLSQVKTKLTAEVIESYLIKIPGYSLLTPDLKEDLINGILADKRVTGELDAEYHCTKIVKYILEAIENSIAYKSCIIVMDKLIDSKTKDPVKIQQAIESIPGFMLISGDIRAKIISSTQSAIEAGRLSIEKKEICRNIALLIEEGIANSEVYKKCVQIIEGLLNDPLYKTESYILEKMKSEIPGFKILPDDKQKKYAKAVLAIDVSKPFEKEVASLCHTITVDIIGMIDGSEVYKKCILTIENIEKNQSKSSFKEEDVIKIFSDEVPGFPSDSKFRTEFAKKIIDAIRSGNLILQKEDICRALAIKEYEGIDGGDLFKQCLTVMEDFLKDPKRKDKTFINTFLTQNLTVFKNLSASKKEELIDLVFSAPIVSDYFFYAAAICKAYEDASKDKENYLACIKSLMLLIIQNQTYAFILGGLETIPEFKALEPSQRSKFAKDIEKIKITKNPDGTQNESETNSAISQSAAICEAASNISPDEGSGQNSSSGFDDPNKDSRSSSDLDLIPAPKDSDRCTVLNSMVFSTYQTFRNKNNVMTAESHQTRINEKLGSDFYIPDAYLQNIEEGIIEDLDIISSTENNADLAARLKYSTIIQSFYNSFTSSNKSILRSINQQARLTFVSRLFRERDFLFRSGINDLVSEDYVVELGKCTRPDKDVNYWTKANEKIKRQNQNTNSNKSDQVIILEDQAAERMQKEIRKEVAPLQNMDQNNSNSGNKSVKEVIESSDQYKLCMQAMPIVQQSYKNSGSSYENFISSSILSENLLSDTQLKGYEKVESDEKDIIRQKILSSISNCTDEKDCQKSFAETCSYGALKLIAAIQKDPYPTPLSEVSKCGFGWNKDPTEEEKKGGKLEFIQLSLPSQKIIVDMGLRLMRGFEISAANTRKKIVNLIWQRTEDKYNSALTANTSPGPVDVSVCTQIMDDIWGEYSEDHLKDLLKGPLDEIYEALSAISEDIENGDTMRDYTAPPSDKCKCYIEKIYAALDKQKISNFSNCEGKGARDNQNLLVAQVLSSKYLTAKQATQAAMSQEAVGRGQQLCSLLFESVQEIAEDRVEINKFANDEKNEPIITEICVQQLRDIHTFISKIKGAYFRAKDAETYTTTNCDDLKDN